MNVSKLLCQYGIDDKPNDIKCARQLLHDVKTAGATLLNAIDAEDRIPTASEEAKLKGIEAEAEQAAVLVSRVEAEMDAERSFHLDALPILSILSQAGKR